MLYFYILHIDR